MSRAIALILTDLEQTRFGLPSATTEQLAGQSILEHTIGRVAKIHSIRSIVLVHPQGQDPLALVKGRKFGKSLAAYADLAGLWDRYLPMRQAARKWAMTSWRGGLWGATCFDELLAADALVAAMDRYGADSALLVGADWPLVDPDLCQEILDRHLQSPQAFAFTFCQAPPGLAGTAIGRPLLDAIARKQGLFGQMLAYNPSAPQADSIGRDVCVQVDPQVRMCHYRLVFDTKRSRKLIKSIASDLGEQVTFASAKQVAESIVAMVSTDGLDDGLLPQMVSLELTPRRLVCGPVVPQHYVDLQRKEMPIDLALSIVEQLGVDGDTVLTLGGLGDALLHKDWFAIICAAREAGVLGVALQTDLLVDAADLEQLMTAPIDVISVRLNADTAKLYDTVMGVDRFAEVVKSLQSLLAKRHERSHGDVGVGSDVPVGLPWIVPHLVKTDQTLTDMETFYDRWCHFAGHAVIEPAQAGCGLAPALSRISMTPPRRHACRQIQRRLTIHSDGCVAQCDQDWLAKGEVADVGVKSLKQIWASMQAFRQSHEEGRWDQNPLCQRCQEWFRP